MMKTLLAPLVGLLLLMTMTVTTVRAAAIDDQARSFLLNVILNGADATLTNGIPGTNTLLANFLQMGISNIVAAYGPTPGIGTNAGVLYLTNASVYSATNLVVQLVATNSTVNSNLTFTIGIDVDVFHTNSLSATNWNFTAGTKGEAIIVFFPQLVNRTFVSPTLGTASFGMFWNSNLDGTIGAWGTLTAGVKYVWAVKQRNTNFYSRMTAWK